MGKSAITRFSQVWSTGSQSFHIHPADGDLEVLPSRREYDLVFHSIVQPGAVVVKQNKKTKNAEAAYQPDDHRLTISGIALTPDESLDVEITIDNGDLMFRSKNLYENFLSLLRAFRLASYAKQALDTNAQEIIADPTKLAAYKPVLTESQMRALLELLTGAGVDHLTNAGPERLILWNNHQNHIVTLSDIPGAVDRA